MGFAWPLDNHSGKVRWLWVKIGLPPKWHCLQGADLTFKPSSVLFQNVTLYPPLVFQIWLSKPLLSNFLLPENVNSVVWTGTRDLSFALLSVPGIPGILYHSTVCCFRTGLLWHSWAYESPGDLVKNTDPDLVGQARAWNPTSMFGSQDTQCCRPTCHTLSHNLVPAHYVKLSENIVDSTQCRVLFVHWLVRIP